MRNFQIIYYLFSSNELLSKLIYSFEPIEKIKLTNLCLFTLKKNDRKINKMRLSLEKYERLFRGKGEMNKNWSVGENKRF